MNKNVFFKTSTHYTTGELIRTVENPEISRKIIELIPPTSNGIALDLGCGEGWISSRIRKRGYYTIGLDINKNMLKKAKKRCDKIIQHNCQEGLPFPDDYFDLVVCCDLLEHLLLPELILDEIHRVLKFDGVGVIKIPNGKLDVLFLLEGHVRFITMKKILEWFENHSFRVKRYKKFAVIPFLRKVVDQIPQFFCFQVKKVQKLR